MSNKHNIEQAAINWMLKEFSNKTLYNLVYSKDYSSIFELENNNDIYFLKLNTINLTYEAKLTKYLYSLNQNNILNVILFSNNHNCFITEKFNAIEADQFIKNNNNYNILNNIIFGFSKIQQSVELNKLKELKLRDLPTNNLVNLFIQEIANSTFNTYLDDLLKIKGKINFYINMYLKYQIQDSIEHGDFHLGNILIDNTYNYKFIDFAEATITNPLFSLISFVLSVNRRLNIDLTNPIIKAIEKTYLLSFSNFYKIPIENVNFCYNISYKFYDLYYIITIIQLLKSNPSSTKWNDRIIFHIEKLLLENQ